MHLLIIPGNPPAAHFYRIWAEEIQQAFSGSSICISPYPKLPTGKDSFKYLKDTAAVHEQQFLAFHQTIQKKVTIIGHSLGAWMALRLLEKHHPIIENCLLLYPFLKKPTLKARAKLKIARYLYQIPGIETLLLNSRGILEKFSTDLRYVSNEELRTSLALAYHEYKVIGRCNKALQIPEELYEKLHMIYCDEDQWCPLSTVNEISQWIVSEKVNATHGFITSPKERQIVLKLLLQRVFYRGVNYNFRQT